MDDATPDQSTGETAAQSPASGGPGRAAAGIPSGDAPSGAVTPGETPGDTVDEQVEGAPDTTGSRTVPGQGPGQQVPPVPSPGAGVGTSVPNVSTAQAPSPEDGLHRGEKVDGETDAGVTSPGSWTALAVPGKPDGEVDTRSR